MSRIGNRQIEVPENVTVTISADNFATVKGPKGELSRQLDQEITINQEGNVITLTRPSDSKDHRSIHGTTRSVLNNMVVGVSTGFERTLELIGVGYRAQMQGKKLVLNVGYSHPVVMDTPEGIKVESHSNTEVNVSGISKQKVGQFAAEIRDVRSPEPYKGKGIRYVGEYVRRKEGKTSK